MLVYSFDIFDTLITRRCGNPIGIFVFIEEILRDDLAEFSDVPFILKQKFFHIRQDSEAIARRKKFEQDNVYEISFEEIYEEIAAAFNLSPQSKKKLMQLELEVETKNIYLIEENMQKVRALLEKGKRVVLISDMYLSSTFLKGILSRLDPLFEKIPLYVSSEFLKSKAQGDLFEYVCSKENISLKKLSHYGDNAHSDYNKPRSLGIHVEPVYQNSLPNVYERFILSHHDNQHNTLVQRMTAASKEVRLATKEKPAITALACGFAAPLFYPFVEWLISTALKDGVKKLFFCSRDGFILKKIADVIITQRNIALETPYLYISRRVVWGLENDQKITSGEQFLYLYGEDFFSTDFGNILLAFNIPKKDVEELLKLPRATFNQKRKFADDLFARHASQMNTTLNESRELLDAFLLQEGLYEPHCALVDIGWVGTIQNSIYKLRAEKTQTPLYGYYYCLIESYLNRRNSKNNRKKSYTSVTFKEFHSPYLTLATFGEAFLFSLEGGVISYLREGSHIVACLSPSAEKKLLEWGAKEYLKGIEDFSRSMVKEIKEWTPQYHEMALSLNKRLIFAAHEPFLELATAIGSIPYSHALNHHHPRYFAPPVKVIDLFQLTRDLLQHKSNFSLIGNTYWLAGSLVQSSSLSRFLWGKKHLLRELSSLPKRILKSILRRLGLLRFIQAARGTKPK